jgi:cytochrome c oxidase cbb3-type subunit 3
MDTAKVRHRTSRDIAARLLSAALLAGLIGGCEAEKRALGPTVPATPPTTLNDPRAARIETNAFEISEGGRQFRWAGCGQCHGLQAPAPALLTDQAWRCGGATTQIYRSIAQGCGAGMPAYGATLTSEQIWRIAAYVHSLPKTDRTKQLRGDNALAGEPEGETWKGPIT